MAVDINGDRFVHPGRQQNGQLTRIAAPRSRGLFFIFLVYLRRVYHVKSPINAQVNHQSMIVLMVKLRRLLDFNDGIDIRYLQCKTNFRQA